MTTSVNIKTMLSLFHICMLIPLKKSVYSPKRGHYKHKCICSINLKQCSVAECNYVKLLTTDTSPSSLRKSVWAEASSVLQWSARHERMLPALSTFAYGSTSDQGCWCQQDYPLNLEPIMFLLLLSLLCTNSQFYNQAVNLATQQTSLEKCKTLKM